MRRYIRRSRMQIEDNRADHGPKERWQHAASRTMEFTEHAGVLAARVSDEHVLDRLLARGMIDSDRHAAGMRLKHDYQHAHIENRLIASYNAARSMNRSYDGGYERSEAEEAAYRRWRFAVRAVGIADSDAVISICCHDRAPRAAQLLPLQRGLLWLAAWYGIRGQRTEDRGQGTDDG